MNKLSNLTAEQLTEIVNQDGRSVSNLSDDKSNVSRFLRDMGIKDGAYLVPNFYLYYIYYTQWNPQGKKLSKIGFLRKVSVVFESKRTKNTRYYLLDGGAFNLSEEQLDEAKRWDQRYRKRVKKENEQKKSGKISGTTEEVQSEDETGLHRN